jgi:threonine dehydratase
MAFELAQSPNVRSLLVSDAAIVDARRTLWDERRVVVEAGAATAYAALTSGVYAPGEDEHVVVILCGANTDPAEVLA